MLVIRGTKKVLDRLPAIERAGDADRSTTRLGDWYVNVLFWKPQVALFVSENTLLPVLIPFAPAATLVDRLPDALLTHLQAHEARRDFAETELAEMQQRRLAKTASRSILGVMNEFRFLADIYHHEDGETDLLALSMRLAELPAVRSTSATSAQIASSLPSCAADKSPPGTPDTATLDHHPQRPRQPAGWADIDGGCPDGVPLARR